MKERQDPLGNYFWHTRVSEQSPLTLSYEEHPCGLYSIVVTDKNNIRICDPIEGTLNEIRSRGSSLAKSLQAKGFKINLQEIADAS